MFDNDFIKYLIKLKKNTFKIIKKSLITFYEETLISYLLRPYVPGDPRSCQMDGRTISTNIGFCFNRTYKRRLDGMSGRTLRWFCQPW